MWVRSSIAFYGNFNLDMDRSPGFGSAPTDSFALLRLGFPSAPHLWCLTSPASATRRTVLQKVRGSTYKVVPQLVNIWFQVLFHSPPGVLFTFPSRYWFTIAHSFIFSLGGWSRLLPTRFLVSRRTQDPIRLRSDFGYRAFTFFGRAFDPVLLSSLLPYHGPSTPVLGPVWASPLSLAATQGITVVFFSSGYLDVSVHRVPLHTLWIGVWIHEVFSCGFPHSEICGSMDICSLPQLIAAYHVFHRLLVPRHPPCALTTLTVAGTIESLDSLFPH